MSNPELAAALNAAGHRTGAGHAFDTKAACNLRHAHRIASPATLTDGEMTPRAIAARLKISTSTVHDWLTTGQLPARRARGGHWAITFTPDVEAACHERLAASGHIHRDADDHDRQPGELSIADPPPGSESSPTSSTTGPNAATYPPDAARAAAAGSTTATRSRPTATDASPAPTNSRTTSKPKPHNRLKGPQYEATVPNHRRPSGSSKPETPCSSRSLRQTSSRPTVLLNRRAQDAISEIHIFSTNRYEWVLECDIKACFDEISHTALMDRFRARIKDGCGSSAVRRVRLQDRVFGSGRGGCDGVLAAGATASTRRSRRWR